MYRIKNEKEVYVAIPKDEIRILHAAGSLMDGRTAMARWIRKWISPIAIELSKREKNKK